jgi:hypothetical protein
MVILVAIVAYMNHRAWEWHKQKDYDRASLWFCGLLFFWSFAIAAMLGPIPVTEEVTVTAEASFLFTAVYLGAVVAAATMVFSEWVGHKDISYKLMFLLMGLLPFATFLRFLDVVAAINQTSVGE